MKNPSHPAPRSSLRPVMLFTVTYLAAAAAGIAITGNREFVLYSVVMLVLLTCLLAVHRRYPFPTPLLWAFSIWGFLHMAGGLMPIPTWWWHEGSKAVLYNWWIAPQLLKFDQLVHAYGFGTTSWLAWHLVRQSLRSPDGGQVRPTFGMMVLCVSVGMGFGALNEVIEFVATRFLKETNVGGYENTGWDLVFNLIGSAIAAVIIRWQSTQTK